MKNNLSHLSFALLMTLLAAAPSISQKVPCEDTNDRDSSCDKRNAFQSTLYGGLGIDSFAAGDLKKLLNPEDNSRIRERVVAGFSPSYRMFRANGSSSGRFRSAQQLWLYGDMAYGLRSADVDCEKAPSLPACTENGFDPAKSTEQTVYVLRNASTLEGLAGLRYEFLPLNFGSPNQASLFVKTEYGFVTVAGNGGDIADNHQWFGLGAIATSGRFRGSYFQLGYGRSEFFVLKSSDRWKAEAYLEWKMSSSVHGFVKTRADTDFGHGSDSVQTYLGIALDLDRLFVRE